MGINDIIMAGPALILQNFGNLGTIVFALPVALLLGFKRECIGMSPLRGREPNVALISERYGSDGPEFRGVMVVYVVGTVFGTIFMGAIASFLGQRHPHLRGGLRHGHRLRQRGHDDRRPGLPSSR